MPTYRFYYISADDQIAARPKTWDGKDDRAAHDHAVSLIAEHSGVEFWAGTRLVGRIYRSELQKRPGEGADLNALEITPQAMTRAAG